MFQMFPPHCSYHNFFQGSYFYSAGYHYYPAVVLWPLDFRFYLQWHLEISYITWWRVWINKKSMNMRSMKILTIDFCALFFFTFNNYNRFFFFFIVNHSNVIFRSKACRFWTYFFPRFFGFMWLKKTDASKWILK